jgi:hypothetical protein
MSVKTDETGANHVEVLNRRGEISTIDITDVIAGKAWS